MIDLVFSLVACIAILSSNASVIPKLSGQHFKITVIQSLSSLVDYDDERDGPLNPNKLSGYIIDMINEVSRPDRASFTYSLFFPSGFGRTCQPQLNMTNETDSAYSKNYRSQYSCGQDDVNEFRLDDLYKTDMYWSLYYITPERQLANQFSIPYVPPASGSITMYGTAIRIDNFDDLVAQQQDGRQGPACVAQATAYAKYIRQAFPDIQLIEKQNDDQSFYQALLNNECTIIIHTYPYATDFITERYKAGECKINDMPVGIIGNTLGFGLSQFGVGIGPHVHPNVTKAISYWMNILMTCAPGDVNGSCPVDSGGSFEELYVQYDVESPDVCGYLNNPPEITTFESGITGLELGKMAGIVAGSLTGIFVIFYFVLHKCKKKELQESYLE